MSRFGFCPIIFVADCFVHILAVLIWCTVLCPTILALVQKQFFPQNNNEDKRQAETRAVMSWIRSTRFTASASFHEVHPTLSSPANWPLFRVGFHCKILGTAATQSNSVSQITYGFMYPCYSIRPGVLIMIILVTGGTCC